MGKLIIIFLFGILFLNLVSPIKIADFYYSQSCPHCQKVMPTIQALSQKYNSVQWNFNDVATGKYNVGGVPLLIFDNFISLSGSQEIPRYAECYLKEMTTRECPTYSADTSTRDWFIRN